MPPQMDQRRLAVIKFDGQIAVFVIRQFFDHVAQAIRADFGQVDGYLVHADDQGVFQRVKPGLLG